MAFGPGIFSVNIEPDLIITVNVSLNQDRGIIIIFKFKIFHTFCNCRIPRWLHIIDDHRMCTSLSNFQFRIKNRVIQRRRYLTETSSDILNDLPVLISAAGHISILFCIRCQGLFYREFFARHQKCSIEKLCCSSDIFHPVTVSGLCGIRPQFIPD